MRSQVNIRPMCAVQDSFKHWTAARRRIDYPIRSSRSVGSAGWRRMRTRRFLEQLRRELPVWIERGWVNPGADRAILDHVAAQAVGTRYLTYALSVLGVLLLGTGIITYFAANWGLIPKAVKLLILFGAMWLAY